MNEPLSSTEVNRAFMRSSLDAISNGASLLPVFKAAGIATITRLLASQASFVHGPCDDAELDAIDTSLRDVGIVNGIEWAHWAPGIDEGRNNLKAIITNARGLEQAEATAVDQAVAIQLGMVTQPHRSLQHVKLSQPLSQPTSPAVHQSKEADLYTDADARTKHKEYTLKEYMLCLAVTAAKDDTYTTIGNAFVATDYTEAKVPCIDKVGPLMRQVKRHQQAEVLQVVAGCNDIAPIAVNVCIQSGDQVCSTNGVRYVEHTSASDARLSDATTMDEVGSVLSHKVVAPACPSGARGGNGKTKRDSTSLTTTATSPPPKSLSPVNESGTDWVSLVFSLATLALAALLALTYGETCASIGAEMMRLLEEARSYVVRSACLVLTYENTSASIGEELLRLLKEAHGYVMPSPPPPPRPPESWTSWCWEQLFS